MVNVDESRIAQVMDNILSNAAKYGKHNDTVEIQIQTVDQGVRVGITDHGPGIPLEFRERIFERFSQADNGNTRCASGTGLGLYIPKQIIEAHRGQLGFHRHPTSSGKGYPIMSVTRLSNFYKPYKFYRKEPST